MLTMMRANVPLHPTEHGERVRQGMLNIFQDLGIMMLRRRDDAKEER